jgi:hypothetical protein
MRSVVFVALAMASLVGCGSSDETQNFSLVPVSGTVTLNGKPLVGAEITFSPDPKNEPSTPGTAGSDSSGNYTVMFRDRSGVAAGKYTVMILKTTMTGGSVASGAEIDPYMASLAAEGQASSKDKPNKIEGTFSVEVPGKDNAYNFDIKASPK